MRLFRFGLTSIFCMFVWNSALFAQTVYPAQPEQFDVQLRYRIRTDRDERIRQFREMTNHLKKIGFVAKPREDADLDIFDPTAERLEGTIPSKNARQLFDDPRIQTVILAPAGYMAPADGKKPVQIRLTLASGFADQVQRDFQEQTSRHLEFLGFRPSVGYDSVGHVLLRGSIPSDQLPRLLKDLRQEPAGWFAPAVPADQLPSPFRATLPVRLVEILPDLPAVAVAPVPAPMGLAPSPKYTQDLLAALADPLALQAPLRVEVVVEEDPGLALKDIQFRIRAATDGVSIEGHLGLTVSIRLSKAADLDKVAALPNVRTIRLPRAGAETGRPLPAQATAVAISAVLEQAHVTKLHQAGYKGQGIRLAVVASEFPGIQTMIGKQLPANTRYIDLTSELNPDVRPMPPSTNRPGTGSIAAVLAHVASPAAQLLLIRVDPTAFHQQMSIARSVIGELGYSDAMQSRSAELVLQSDYLSTRRRIVVEEYRRALADLSDDDKSVLRRAQAKEALDKLLADEATFNGATLRFTELKQAIDELRGVNIVFNTLVWDTGYPQDGLSELSRYLDLKFSPQPVVSALAALKQPPIPLWIQPASMAVDRVWAGPFLDHDGDGALDFAGLDDKIPGGQWSHELNFLGVRGLDGKTTTVLPAGMKVRLTIQWREPHDPGGFLPADAAYPMTLRLMKQVDPTGKTVASDELIEVSRSQGSPVRLLNTRASMAFEQTLETTIPADGVYGLRVESRSAAVYPLPGLKMNAELYPRIVVESIDAMNRGEAIFRSYRNNAAGVGLPGDSSATVCVGTTTPPGGTPMNLVGAGPGIALHTKPELFLPGMIEGNGVAGEGSFVSAAVAAGTGASLLSAGVRANDLARAVERNPGRPLQLPKSLLDLLERQRRER